MSLKFTPGNHSYKLDGLKVQGVTTILNAAIPKPALVNWAAKSVAEFVADNESEIEALRRMGREPMVNALKSVPNQKKNEAGVRGHDVHALAEKLVHGEEIEVPEHLAARVSGLAKLLDQFHIEPLLTEVSVGNRKLWYAGRLDLLAKLNDEIWLLDFKTSKGVYGETALQTAAYAKSEFYVNDGAWDEELALPFATRIGVIHITDEGSTLHELGDVDKAFKIFSHVNYLAKNFGHLKTAVGEAMVPNE